MKQIFHFLKGGYFQRRVKEKIQVKGGYFQKSYKDSIGILKNQPYLNT